MPAGHFWSVEQDAQLRQHWDAGHSTAEIGRRMGVTKNSIIGRAHRLALPNRARRAPPPPSPVMNQQKEIIRNLWATASFARISQYTGLGETRIKAVARELNLPGRDPALARTLKANAHRKSWGVVSRPTARSPELPRERRARAAFPSPARPGDPRPAVASGLIGVSSQPNSPGAASNPRPVFLAGKCQFPLWSNRERPTHAYCEAPTVARRNGCASPFCATHYAVAYEPPRPKPERKAA
jgi:hypothetical protein